MSGERCCPGAGSMAHVRGCVNHPEPTPTPVPSEVAETTAGEREVEACPAKWCAYPMPHDHTSGSGPTFDALPSDPTQQLDTEGVVLASVLAHQAEPRRLTTAEREWLDDSMMHGFDALVHTVERLMERAADEVRPRSVAETTAGEREVEAWQRETAARLGRGDHWPTTPVQCVCGWRETDADSGTWVEHMSAALLDRVRREEGAKVLREAADALEAHRTTAWTEGPKVAAHWLRARAASVGRGGGAVMTVDWDDVANWGGRVHIGTTDDLGDHGRHCDEADGDD